MTQIEKDITALEGILKKREQPVIVLEAIRGQIERLRRKKTGTGKNRKTKTADGVEVSVGAILFGFSLPSKPWREKPENPPSITEHKVEAINAVGKATFSTWSGRAFYYITDKYSTREAAHKAMLEAAKKRVEDAKERIVSARSEIETCKRRLSVVKAFNPNPAPAKTTRKKRAA